jgi:DNA-binding response OmpR family regulator/dethiobiotin synthetase
MSILVVDDNTMLLSKIVRSLMIRNRDVRSASSLEEARQLLNQEIPEVLCLDLQLPDGSGLDLLEEIRSAGKTFPVVIISGHYSKQNRDRAARLGVSGFFSKPFVLQDLHKLLDSLLEEPASYIEVNAASEDDIEDDIKVAELEKGPQLKPLNLERSTEAKRAYSTRHVALQQATQLLVNGYQPKSGDLVLARVDKRFQHTHLQLPDGRRSMMNAGDEIIVCYGNRYAPDQFEAEVPQDLSPCHLVAAGGIASLSLSRNNAMKSATQIIPVGVLADSEGKALNLKDYSFAVKSAPKRRPPVTVVMGTSMNAGKTTVAADLILGMTREGLQVGSAKVTGTGAGGDVFRMRDSGAKNVYDFTDCGYPTTYKVSLENCIEIMQTLIAQLTEDGSDSIVIEVADGILQEETRGLVLSKEFRALTDDIIFAAGDAMGALGGSSWLQQQGLNVIGVSGVITSSPLAMREFSQNSDIPVYTRADLKSGDYPQGGLLPRVDEEENELLENLRMMG